MIMVKGLTKRFFDDPLGATLLVAVIVATALREAGDIIPAPWDRVAGGTIALLYAYGFVSKPAQSDKTTPPIDKTTVGHRTTREKR